MWACIAAAWAADPSADPVGDAAAAEIARALAAVAGRPDAPYFLAVTLTDEQRIQRIAEDGALAPHAPQRSRRVDVDVRIGGPTLDSSHALRTERSDEGTRAGRALPLDDDPAVLGRVIWREIDGRLREAEDRWSRVSADRAILVAERAGPDLAPRTPAVADAPWVALSFDPTPWEAPLRTASATLASGVVRDGSAGLWAAATHQWFLASDGERVRQGAQSLQIQLRGEAVAPDGTVLSLYRSWHARTPDQLPAPTEVVDAAASLASTLEALVRAPEQPPYNGPVVLSDRAAGVFFHEIFGHRMEGHRLKRVDNAQTFNDLVHQPILPAFLDVVDDPTLPTWQGTPLRGHYRYDDEGVAAERVSLVDDGVLQGFLQSRSPHAEDGRSNGHGRAEPGLKPVSRQGNLIVTAATSVADDALRAQLVAAARAQGQDYALWIDDIQGGFTYTSRGIPNAFQVDVLLAHRVYVDGRPDELVRGIDLIGTPLVAFSRIAAAGESHAVFNGVCGAESGWVPVSAVAPALLVSQLETQRKTKGQHQPPLLPPPEVPR